MNISTINAVSAMRSAQMRIDMIGNNIANVKSTGFQSQEMSFGSILAQADDTLPEDPAGNRMTPPGLRVGTGGVANLHRYNTMIGEPEQTGVPTDLYLDGNAYFQVRSNGGETRYSRAGQFVLNPSVNGQMILTTTNGDALLSADGNPIVVPADYDIEVATTGEMTSVHKQNKMTFNRVRGSLFLIYPIAKY